jgi:predicted transcriptional regulator
MACDILRVLSEGQAKPTHILQKANMNWTVLCSNLEYLYGRGLVDRVGRRGERTEYRLTLKGRSILELYEELKLSLRGLASVRTTPSGQALRDGRRARGMGKGLDWSVAKTWTFSTGLS